MSDTEFEQGRVDPEFWRIYDLPTDFAERCICGHSYLNSLFHLHPCPLQTAELERSGEFRELMRRLAAAASERPEDGVGCLRD